jgi:hypothetical protein
MANIATYNLQVLSPYPDLTAPSLNESEKRVLADLPAILELAQEELSDRLPTGFRVRIAEWDAPPLSNHEGDGYE